MLKYITSQQVKLCHKIITLKFINNTADKIIFAECNKHFNIHSFIHSKNTVHLIFYVNKDNVCKFYGFFC